MKFFLSLACGVALLFSATAHASSIDIGNMAAWSGSTSWVTGNKTFTYLSSSGTWNGSELLTLSSNIPQKSHSLGIVSLSSYIGPQNLSVSYRVDITDNEVFKTVALDQNHTGDNVTTTKDVFVSESDFLADTPLVTLVALNNLAPVDAALPGVQSLWVRDTIVIDDTGSLFGVSNTYVQMVPEPGTYALAGVGIALAAAQRLRHRLTAGRRGKTTG
jgi:hypothetical protein